jgi:hypothetical protein
MATFLPHIAEQAFVDGCKPCYKALTDQTPALIQNSEDAYSNRKTARKVALSANDAPAAAVASSINIGPPKDVWHKRTAPAGY